MKTGKVRAADSVMLQAYAQKYLTRIVQLLGMVPSDLLLLFKTNDCLRHLDALVGSGVNSSAGTGFMMCCMSVMLQCIGRVGQLSEWTLRCIRRCQLFHFSRVEYPVQWLSVAFTV
jgi:hypothetical protein